MATSVLSPASSKVLSQGDVATTDSIQPGANKINRQFSFSEHSEESNSAKQTEHTREIRREDLNTKAANNLKHTESKLLNDISKVLGIPFFAKKDVIKPLIQQMSDEYLRTGQVSEETRTRIFEEAYAAGVDIDKAFYEQYKDLADPLRTTAITLNPENRSDLANYHRFCSEANRNKMLRITDDGGLSVEAFYEKMRDLAPELFPGDITRPADQLQRLYNVSQNIAVSQGSLDAYSGSAALEHKKNERSYFDREINEAIANSLKNIRRYGEDKLFSKEEGETISVEGEMRRQAQVHIILNNADLDEKQRAILYYGLASTDVEKELMDKLVEAGAEYDGMVKFVSEYFDIDRWEGDNKKHAYRELLSSSKLTEEEKTVVMGKILGMEEKTESGNPSIYAKFKMAAQKGLSVDDFMAIYEAPKSPNSNMDQYFELTDVGIRKDDAVKLVVEMAELKPKPREDEVSWYQKCDVILGSRLTESAQVQALQTVCNEYTGAKIQIGYDNGLPPGALIYLKQQLPEFDANDNGNYSQKEVTSAIDAVCGDDNFIYAMTGTSPHGFRLSNEQKAVLWQLQTGAKNGKGNPYSVRIGKQIYDLVQADKDARKEEE